MESGCYVVQAVVEGFRRELAEYQQSPQLLHNLLHRIMSWLFGLEAGPGPGLNMQLITRAGSPFLFEMLRDLLEPRGRLLKMLDLLGDTEADACFTFPLGHLPSSVRAELKRGTALLNYTAKLKVDAEVDTLRLNPFEYYMYYFLICQGLGLGRVCPENELVRPPREDSLYAVLAADYLHTYLPLETEARRPDALWKSAVLGLGGVELWTAMPSERQVDREALPSLDQVGVVTAFARHLHRFTWGRGSAAAGLDELRRTLLTCRSKWFAYLLYLLTNWPRDSSLGAVVNLWLAYVSPWSAVAAEAPLDPLAYRPFILDNFLFYSVLVRVALGRLGSLGLCSLPELRALLTLLRGLPEPLLHLLRTAEPELLACPGGAWSEPARTPAVEDQLGLLTLAPTFGSPAPPEAVALHHTLLSLKLELPQAQPPPPSASASFLDQLFGWSSGPSFHGPSLQDVELVLAELTRVFPLPSSLQLAKLQSGRPCAPLSSPPRPPTLRTYLPSQLLADPELVPATSREFSWLLPWALALSARLNRALTPRLIAAYHAPGLAGALARRLLLPPTPGPASTPPRISLRFLASKLFYLYSLVTWLVFTGLGVPQLLGWTCLFTFAALLAASIALLYSSPSPLPPPPPPPTPSTSSSS